MNKPDLDNTLKNVVKETMRECINRNINVDENFLVYYAKLLVLNPAWGIKLAALPDRNYVMKFVQYCIKGLEDYQNIGIITLKMQLYFMDSFDSIEAMIKKNRSDLKERLAPLENEVLATNTDDEEELLKLYKKIVYLVTLYPGLGNPTIQEVYDEAYIALRSVFLETDLKEFMDQKEEDKEMQIVELTELVTGIRLFNRDCKKGGIGIEDLTKLLPQAIDATRTDINESLQTIMNSVYDFTTAIDNSYVLEFIDNDDVVLTMELPAGVTEEDLECVKDSLVAYRQYELCVRKILVELGKIESMAKDRTKAFHEALDRIQETVRYRIAIPTIQVFPLFVDVAHIWTELQNQVIALSQLNQILFNLKIYINELSGDEDMLKQMVGPKGPVTDKQRMEKTNGLVLPPLRSNDAVRVMPEQTEEFEKVQLQLLGFCAWKLVETDGGLIPGDPNMGVAKVEDKYYSFSSQKAAVGFGGDPLRYVRRALDLARKKPQIINLLQLKDQLIAVREVNQLVTELPPVIITHDTDIQTDIHPIPYKIDSRYKWNIWDWKREAILLANLSRRVTVSSQTVVSQGWKAARAQTHYTKDHGYQTKKDNYTNVPTLANFIFGLRGRKDDNQHIVDLTRPVDE